uniref:Uncharacterized protein n=1 Tax=Solanum tuberosum TaxID=4113 RepID=M1D2Y5_SOLTU
MSIYISSFDVSLASEHLHFASALCFCVLGLHISVYRCIQHVYSPFFTFRGLFQLPFHRKYEDDSKRLKDMREWSPK